MKPFYFAILAAIVWGVAPIVEKAGLGKIEPVSGVLIRSLGVLLGALVLGALNSNLLKLTFQADKRAMIFLMMGGVIASILGQIFFYNALKTGEVSKMVPIAATYPLVSFILGLLFFGENLTVSKGLGICLVILGVFFLR